VIYTIMHTKYELLSLCNLQHMALGESCLVFGCNEVGNPRDGRD